MAPNGTEFSPGRFLLCLEPRTPKSDNTHRERERTHSMHTLIEVRKLFLVLLVCFAVSPQLKAAVDSPNVVPPPDGDYGNGNTAEGFQALFNLNNGAFNTALGWRSLYSDVNGSFNTGAGAGTLALNLTLENTATGAGAMLLTTTGLRNTATGSHSLLFNGTGVFNGAFGSFALFNNDDGFSNNAVGESALFDNIHGAENTAVGDLALANNDFTGDGLANFNTAVGAMSLFSNSNGDSNNAVGAHALVGNTTGLFNQAMGFEAMRDNGDGSANVAIGDTAMAANGSGDFNTMIGDLVAPALSSGSDNIYIGATAGADVISEDGTIRIGDVKHVGAAYVAGIFGAISDPGVPVYVNPDGKLGTILSSARFKDNIKPMDNASGSILSLKPVTFRYKKEIGGKDTTQFGLIAEEVAKVNPDLVVMGPDGKPYTVRYEAVNAMLLNEFIKEHQLVQKQQDRIASQEAKIDWLTATVKEQASQIQKVSAQLEMIKPAPQVVENR
jgi:trimeric autotransporter adhesin